MAKAPKIAKKAKIARVANTAKKGKEDKKAKVAKKANVATATRLKPAPASIPPTFAPVVAAFATDRAVSRRKMFSSENVLSVNGKIFAMLGRGSLVVKLPRARVDELVKAGQGKLFDPGHGRLMKEWVSVELGAAPWVALAEEAHRFVGQGE
jgi:hypothetical protein